jgi:hypothetical protein
MAKMSQVRRRVEWKDEFRGWTLGRLFKGGSIVGGKMGSVDHARSPFKGESIGDETSGRKSLATTMTDCRTYVNIHDGTAHLSVSPALRALEQACV